MTLGILMLAAALVPMPKSVVWRDGSCAAVPGTEVTCVGDRTVPEEGYRLSVTGTGITIRASTAAGRFYAEKTLEQLAENGRYRCCEIEDAPAYRWRGIHVDEARHFFGKQTVKRVLDEMSRLKMNRFHWHLTDDQGWRIEMKKYPELTQYGATRPSSPVRGIRWQRAYDGTPYGPYFYTEDEIREIVAYAAARHIEIVPEIDVPGHCQGLLAGYPWMLCEGQTLKPRAARNNWWMAQVRTLCIGNDAAIRQIEGIFDELMRLFPGTYIHIGGDECPHRYWENCAKCRAKMNAEGLRNAAQLQVWFSRHLAAYLAAKGRRAIGWDEILAGGLPTNCAVMSWRGAGGGIAAARAGHEVVMTPCRFCYLNRAQPVDTVYAFDPAEGVSASARKFILGGQACVWTESVYEPSDLENRLFPRVGALAEALWTAPAARSYRAFRTRLDGVRAGEAARGVRVSEINDRPHLSVVGDWRVALEWGADRVAFDVPPGSATRGMKPVTDRWGVVQEGPQRLDTIVRTADGRYEYRVGREVAFLPEVVRPAAGEAIAGRLWITVKTRKLTEAELYPVRETSICRRQCCWNEPIARDCCPKTVKKLMKGERLRILVWGDSCTAQDFLKPEDRWQNRFAKRLKEIYPKADVELVEHTWSGYTTHDFLAQKPGAEHNFLEKVVGAHPDLVISEFVNDGNYNNCGTNPELGVEKARKYAETTILADYATIARAFREKGVEWIVCLPHYTRPEWMGKTSPQQCDDDPRPYCKVLRKFAKAHKVGLADASRYWGALRELGIPYPVYFNNGINHPELDGMKFYDWALDDLFRNGEPIPDETPAKEKK